MPVRVIHSNSQSKTAEQAGSPRLCAERVGGGLEARVEGLGHREAGSAELGLYNEYISSVWAGF